MHYGTLNDYKFADQDSDIRGTNLYGVNDEKLGTIHDVIFDHESGTIKYAVIDTGGWLHHNYFLVPASQIRPYEKHEDHFFANLTKKQVEALPPYDSKVVKDRDKWTDYESRYEKAWTDEGGILHAKGSPRIITPDPAQVTGTSREVPLSSAGASNINVADVFPERITNPTKLPTGPTTMLRPEETNATSAAVSPTSSRNESSAGTSFVETTAEGTREAGTHSDRDKSAAGGNPPPRWDRFQSRLNRDITSIRTSCSTCGSSKKLGSTGYDEDAQRKVG